MGRFPWLSLSAVASALCLCSSVVRGQSPAEKEVLVNPAHVAGDQYLYDLACQRSSVCIVLWDYGVFSADQVFQGVRLGATTLAPAGGIRRERVYAEDPFEVNPVGTTVGQQFVTFWTKTVTDGPNGFRSQPVFQRLGPDLEQLGDPTYLSEPAEGLEVIVQSARIPGGFVALWAGHDRPLPDSSEGAFLGFSGDAGEDLHAPVRVSAEADGEQDASRGGLAVDLRRGVITVAYAGFRDGEPPDGGVFCRRFSLNGESLTPDLRMNATQTTSHGWGFPAVATSPNGGFVAVWVSQGQDGSHLGVFGRRFNEDGLPLGPEFQVNQVTLSDQSFPRVASDAAGNFVVVWTSYDPSSFGVFAWDVKARLYRADGRPVGPEVVVNQYLFNYQDSPLVAFARNGTFVAAWRSFAQVPPDDDNLSDVFARRFSASPADEPCLVGGGKFRCDTGRTGGELEVEHSFGGAGSGLGFMGDVDADGREDPCVYAGGTFRCDTDHEGGKAEVLIPFVVAGATVPLLGDMDGDRRADPCLASPGTFSCAIRHDGGAAELKIKFGQPGETMLLGDVDGDHRAEACAFAGGLFRCDTGHNGGKAEVLIRFGQRGDQALLGDFDGDGRDDPCLFRSGVLSCDTAHDGGAAEAMLSLGSAGDTVVLGNLDGL